MTERDFRTPSEELERLQEEIAETKDVLREMLARLSQIERHASRLSPGWKRAAQSTNHPTSEIAGADSSMSRSQALQVFDGLVDSWRQRGYEAVQGQLAKLQLPELVVLARELGVPVGKPSRKGVTHKILGRVKESVLLSRNVNVTPPSHGTAHKAD